MQCNIIRAAWSLAVLKEWEHPLFRLALDTLAIAQRNAPTAKARHASRELSDRNPPRQPTERDVPTLDIDSESGGSGVEAEAGLEPMHELEAFSDEYAQSQRDDTGSASDEAPSGGVGGASETATSSQGRVFRGATGRDRVQPMETLPPYSALQLVQCMLLASAAGKTNLLAMLPEHLRVSCGGAWKRALLSATLPPTSSPTLLRGPSFTEHLNMK